MGGSYLPACEAVSAQEMPTRLNTSVLIPLCTDLTQLEGAADVTVKLILLLLGVTVVVVVRKTRQEMIREYLRM